MIIYPAIDLRGGRVVRLTEGKFDQEKTYGDDPLAVAKDFAASGATWLHVVDLDGAKDPAKRQTALVQKLARESGLRMQTGGGIRDESQIAALLAAGAQRVIVGSLAAKQPELVRGWLKQFGAEKIILSPDVRLDVDGTPRVAAAGAHQHRVAAAEIDHGGRLGRAGAGGDDDLHRRVEWGGGHRRRNLSFPGAEGGRHRRRVDPARERGGRTTARSTGGTSGVVRVAGHAEHRVERVRARTELGRVRLADRDGARRLQPLDDEPVGVEQRRHGVAAGSAGGSGGFLQYREIGRAHV